MKILAVLAVGLLIAAPALAADPAGSETSFGCLSAGAVMSLLPVLGYTEIKRLGEQKGATYFDPKLGTTWYRVAIDTCRAVLVSRQARKGSGLKARSRSGIDP